MYVRIDFEGVPFEPMSDSAVLDSVLRCLLSLQGSYPEAECVVADGFERLYSPAGKR